MRIFTDTAGGGEHIVLSKGDLAGPEPVLVRMHAIEPARGRARHPRPAAATSSRDAMLAIAAEGRGVVVLLRDTSHEARHRRPRLAAPAAPVRASARRSSTRSACRDLVLLTNSPSPRPVGLDGYGLSIAGTRPIRGPED